MMALILLSPLAAVLSRRLVNQMIDECLARVIANPSEQKDTLLKLAAQHDSLRSGDLYSTIHDCIGAGIEVVCMNLRCIFFL